MLMHEDNVMNKLLEQAMYVAVCLVPIGAIATYGVALYSFLRQVSVP